MSMFSGHPKGLYVAFFANMGERFGFYTMMGILVFYLTGKFGMAESSAGYIYSGFYFAIYALALVGGIIADKTQNYKGVIFIGLITMLGGYVLMAVPGFGVIFTVIALFVIAFGNGLFKGNLQAVVGQLYDNPKFSHLRDSAFNLFYMGINVGALFAPYAASGLIKYFMNSDGFIRNDAINPLAHKMIEGTINAEETGLLQGLADKVAMNPFSDLTQFATDYVAAYGSGFNMAFAAAGATMIISVLVFTFFKGMLPDVKKKAEESKDKGAVKEMSPEETRQRMTALLLVFAVVIFFWMAFHQNGLTLSFFARDYTVQEVGAFEYLFFDLKSLLAIIVGFFGLLMLFGKNKGSVRGIGALLTAGGASLAYYFYTQNEAVNAFSPELFQPFNPSFIVILTPVVLGFFAFLNKRKLEPSAPRKIGIGMIITAVAFTIMLIGSQGLDLFASLTPGSPRVGVSWLIGTYFTLTIAELFLSPMGISFVSKVSPPKYQGLMQGGWLGATALGNQFLWIGSFFYERIAIWQVWGIFISLSLIAAVFIFSIMKKLEKVSK